MRYSVCWIHRPIGDDAALAQLWDEYEVDIDEPDDSVVSDTESDTDSDVEVEEMATGSGADVVPVNEDVVPVNEEGDDETEFDMRRNDMDAAIERAVALPEFVLSREDDIAKAAAFRFVYIH